MAYLSNAFCFYNYYIGCIKKIEQILNHSQGQEAVWIIKFLHPVYQHVTVCLKFCGHWPKSLVCHKICQVISKNSLKV